MNFTINKKDILGTLSRIQGILTRKSNLSITQNILIKTTEKGISISATDLETAFKGFYPAEIKESGILTINGQKFFEIVQKFPSDDINVNEIENQWIKIGNDKVDYHIIGMDHKNFPEIKKVDEIEFIEIDSYSFKNMIDKTIAISALSNEKRAHILGINFEKFKDENNKNVIRLVSTDGGRLSKMDYFCDDTLDFSDSQNIIIPKKGLSELNKFIDSEGSIKIGLNKNYFVLKKENETVIINLLEGTFPVYSELIKTNDEYIIKVNKNNFLMMLKRMSILYSDNYNSVSFKFANNKLFITASNPELGESKEDIDIDFQRDEIEAAFNPKYFIETLSLIGTENVILHVKDSESPCHIQSDTDDKFLNIIMPMKI